MAPRKKAAKTDVLPGGNDPILLQLRQFVSRQALVFALMVGYSATPLVIDLLAGVGPPWPHRSGVVAFTSIAGLFFTAISYVTERNRAADLSLSRQRVQRLGFFTGGVLCAYIVMSAAFLFDAPDRFNRISGGFLFTPQWLETSAKFPLLTIEAAVKENPYQIGLIWVPWTISIMNACFLITWIMLVGFVEYFLGTFVAFLEKEHATANAESPPLNG